MRKVGRRLSDRPRPSRSSASCPRPSACSFQKANFKACFKRVRCIAQNRHNHDFNKTGLVNATRSIATGKEAKLPAVAHPSACRAPLYVAKTRPTSLLAKAASLSSAKPKQTPHGCSITSAAMPNTERIEVQKRLHRRQHLQIQPHNQ
jgi:hypothetical protein